jgi:hypothetical protein
MAKITLGFTIVILASYALPHRFIQAALRDHYRDWMTSQAYWGRAYYKWIVKYRIFYTDEFTSDLLIAALCGLISGAIFSLLSPMMFDGFLREDLFLELFLPPFVATTALLFVTAQIERMQFIDDELRTRKELEPKFDNLAWLEEITLAAPRRKYVKRIIASPLLNHTR